jgi:hypothetical protein
MRVLIGSATTAIIAIAVAATAATSQGAPSTPVAVELFTSQGCSSCPPADAIAERLAKEPNTVVITRPVTYWDRLGWKDTLAREANTSLQNAYAARGGRGSGVYTPQSVVQGGDAAVGNRESELRQLISAEKKRPGPSVSAVRSEDGGRIVTIDGTTPSVATVTVVALKSESLVRIGRGENGGRSVKYTNVALADTNVARWRGGKLTFSVPGDIFKAPGADRYALVVQLGTAGRIVAARYI